MREFDVSANLLTGVIPVGLFSLLNIVTIALNDNQFEGTIPATIGNAPSLIKLALNGNNLTGGIPSINPGDLTNLKEFFVHENQLTGVMDPSICELRNPTLGVLEMLWADCGDSADPLLVCASPECCTRCFPDEASLASQT